ncbi:MAG: hypothetical protein A2W31_08925 [Planctomycetes bacterium RBG_16_64_10]|nr:MAG: hypothetical protein A2W31_08925 [Planctomycetes bacterium RBG_16_64_10]
MNGRQRILQALRGNSADVVPTFEWSIDETVGKALTGTTDALEIVERLDLDGVNVRADYRQKYLDPTTLVDEWGITRQLTGDWLPALMKSPIEDVGQHLDYEFPDPTTPERFAALQRAVERFGDERAVVLNLRDGFSDMRDLLGYQGALMAMLSDPRPFSELLERVVLYNIELAAIARKRYGIEIVATTDDVANASGLLMRPDTYFECIGPGFQQVIQGFKELGYLAIKHCDGNIDAVVDFWVDSGIDCLDPIDPAAGYTIAGMKARYGGKICLKGNVDCTGALCNGTPEEVSLEVRQCLDQGGRDGGFILSSSNTIHCGVKPENYRAMLQALRTYDRYPDPV